jgi:hypothetical protein
MQITGHHGSAGLDLLCVGQLGSIADIRDGLALLKRHLCENDGEADNFHPDWIVVPTKATLKRAINSSTSFECAFVDLVISMYAPLCLEAGVNIVCEMETLRELNFDLRLLFYRLQASKINRAYKDKYDVEFSQSDVAEDYKARRMEGMGRLQVCGNLHLGFCGEYEGRECSSWSFDSTKSMIDIATRDPNLVYLDKPKCISVDNVKHEEDDGVSAMTERTTWQE